VRDARQQNFLNASERIFIAEDKPEVVASALHVDRSSGKWLILDRSSSRLMFDIRDMTRWCRRRRVEGQGQGWVMGGGSHSSPQRDAGILL
jgi:hypothetical protein